VSEERYAIVLVDPNLLPGSHLASNVGLACLEAYLAAHDLRVRTVDAREIEGCAALTDVVGMSVMDHSYAAARALSRRLPGKTVIWGGWTATAAPELILARNAAVDYVVVGEGERTLLRLLRCLADGGFPDTLDGVACRRPNGGVLLRPPSSFLDLDGLPIPTRLAVLDRLVFLELARGCHGRCGYCQETPRMRWKSAGRILAEIEHWHAAGFRHFYFGDANSLANVRLLREVLDGVEQREMPIEVLLAGRPDDALRALPVLESLARSRSPRLHSIEVGIEADSPGALELLGRRGTPDTNRRAIRALCDLRDRHSPGTRIHANLILFPHFDMSFDDFVANVRFVGDFRCSREVLGMQLYGLANTPVWHAMRSRGFRPDEDHGFQIAEYTFSDPEVEALFEALVRRPLAREQRRPGFALSHRRALQHRVHDQVIGFYDSGDIRAAALRFAGRGGAPS